MPPLYVFEDSQVDRLAPLTYTRAAFELRVGACTLLERIARTIGMPIAGVFVRSGLAEVVRQRLANTGAQAEGEVGGGGGEGGIPVNTLVSSKEGIILVNARWLMLSRQEGQRGAGPVEGWKLPDENSVGVKQNAIVWMRLSGQMASQVDWSKLHEARTLEAVLPELHRVASKSLLIERPWDLLEYQRAAMLDDFAELGAINDATVYPGVHILAAENVHLAKGVKVWPGVVLDAQAGPIIVGEFSEIRANAVITGPVAIGAHCVIRTGADIREECSFGQGSRVGGEVIGSVILGHANKQHHGFMGQSIIGEWANLGAGTTTSNLKNTYGSIKMHLNGADESTGRQFLGSIIADHAKLGIGTYLSTGSVVGFGSHVVVGRPPRFVPSFAWLTDKGMQRAEFEKIEQIAATVMQRRGTMFTSADHELFVRIAGEWSLAENYPWPDTQVEKK